MSWLDDAEVKTAEHKASEKRESDRKALQSARDASLQAMTHTFADGSIVQVRPQDMSNFQTAIAIGQDRDWIMSDNSVRLTTVSELQEALNSGIAQGQVVWAEYAAALKSL